MANKRELTEKEKRQIALKKRINKEIRRLNEIFKNIDKDEKSIVDGLIRACASTRIQLEDYDQDLKENGWTESFTQSPNTPAYERQRPVAGLYNNLLRTYKDITKELLNLLPKSDKKVVEVDDGFDKFVQAKKIR